MVSHQGIGRGIAHPIEVVETVLEVADVAWNAYDHHHHHHPRTPSGGETNHGEGKDEDGDLSKLRSENRHLKEVLVKNAALLRNLSDSPAVSSDCPKDLYQQLMAVVESSSFCDQLELLQHASSSPGNSFPFKDIQGEHLETHPPDILDNGNLMELSTWVWVTEEMVPGKSEEQSKIGGDNYIIVDEEDVVDGIANFIAKCILANPRSKKLSPAQLQKAVARALGGMDWTLLKKVWRAGKLIYSLSTWGIALAALYRNRVVVKAAARGLTTSAKFIMKII